MQASRTTSDVNTGNMPAESVRTVVSFLIFLHFFALAVAVLSNWNPSDLALRLRRVPLLKPYIEYLTFDQSYVPLYGFTFGMPEDTDCKIEVSVKLDDGSEKTWVLPDEDVWPRQRRRHEARLVETAADMTGEDYRNFQSIVPQAIAAYVVAQEPQAKSGVIRCTRQLQQPLQDLASSNTSQRDPYRKDLFRQLYEARILISGDSVNLLKSESAAEVAQPADKKTSE
jgi:hypothetical protein